MKKTRLKLKKGVLVPFIMFIISLSIAIYDYINLLLGKGYTYFGFVTACINITILLLTAKLLFED